MERVERGGMKGLKSKNQEAARQMYPAPVHFSKHRRAPLPRIHVPFAAVLIRGLVVPLWSCVPVPPQNRHFLTAQPPNDHGRISKWTLLASLPLHIGMLSGAKTRPDLAFASQIRSSPPSTSTSDFLLTNEPWPVSHLSRLSRHPSPHRNIMGAAKHIQIR
jgi:hypothetical protein